MRVAFAADHAGAAFKDELIRRLVVELGGVHELTDLGGDGSDPNDDYPDFAQALGEAVRDGRADRGILICGSGVGASVAANKIPGHPGRHLPRHVLGAPGRRARRHERADARVAGHRDRARRRVLARVPRRDVLAASRATSAGWTRCWRSRRRPGPGTRTPLGPAVRSSPQPSGPLRSADGPGRSPARRAPRLPARRSTSPPTSTPSGRRPSPTAGRSGRRRSSPRWTRTSRRSRRPT